MFVFKRVGREKQRRVHFISCGCLLPATLACTNAHASHTAFAHWFPISVLTVLYLLYSLYWNASNETQSTCTRNKRVTVQVSNVAEHSRRETKTCSASSCSAVIAVAPSTISLSPALTVIFLCTGLSHTEVQTQCSALDAIQVTLRGVSGWLEDNQTPSITVTQMQLLTYKDKDKKILTLSITVTKMGLLLRHPRQTEHTSKLWNINIVEI